MVTTVLLPAIRKTQPLESRLELFETIESRFGFQAKLATVLTGLSGFYMLHVMYASRATPWWIYIMILVWSVFMAILFVLEPLFLNKWLRNQAKINSDKVLMILQVGHIGLLAVSLIAIFFGVAGAHGLLF